MHKIHCVTMPQNLTVASLVNLLCYHAQAVTWDMRGRCQMMEPRNNVKHTDGLRAKHHHNHLLLCRHRNGRTNHVSKIRRPLHEVHKMKTKRIL